MFRLFGSMLAATTLFLVLLGANGGFKGIDLTFWQSHAKTPEERSAPPGEVVFQVLPPTPCQLFVAQANLPPEVKATGQNVILSVAMGSSATIAAWDLPPDQRQKLGLLFDQCLELERGTDPRTDWPSVILAN